MRSSTCKVEKTEQIPAIEPTQQDVIEQHFPPGASGTVASVLLMMHARHRNLEVPQGRTSVISAIEFSDCSNCIVIMSPDALTISCASRKEPNHIRLSRPPTQSCPTRSHGLKRLSVRRHITSTSTELATQRATPSTQRPCNRHKLSPGAVDRCEHQCISVAASGVSRHPSPWAIEPSFRLWSEPGAMLGKFASQQQLPQTAPAQRAAAGDPCQLGIAGFALSLFGFGQLTLRRAMGTAPKKGREPKPTMRVPCGIFFREASSWMTSSPLREISEQRRLTSLLSRPSLRGRAATRRRAQSRPPCSGLMRRDWSCARQLGRPCPRFGPSTSLSSDAVMCPSPQNSGRCPPSTCAGIEFASGLLAKRLP